MTMENFMKSDPKWFWGFLSLALTSFPSLKVDGQVVDNPETVANVFKTFFQSVFSENALR